MDVIDLELVDEGTGIPVVFSHGGSSDLRYWEPQREAFAARHRFVAYSRRFHGVNPWPGEGDNSDDAHVTDLLVIIHRLDAGPAHLVGFSAAIALRATVREPRLVRSLTIIEPNVPWLLEGDPEGEAVLAWWRAENNRVRTEAAGSDERRAVLWFELVNNRGSGTFATQPEAFRRMWHDNFARRRPDPGPSRPLACDRLSTIGVPTLVVSAEHGMPYSRTIVDRLAKCIPGAALVVVPGVSHFMSYQDPGLFNETVLTFLGDHDGQ